MFKRSEDIRKSALALLDESKEFSTVCRGEEPFYIGFTCNFSSSICKNVNVVEAHIDSTYKTNSSKFELFAVLGSFLGSGFPIGYLFLEGGSGDDARGQRGEVLRVFLEALKRELKEFLPLHFFTDKDFGQINAIQECYGVIPCLCLWHVFKAVRLKISALSSCGPRISKEHRSKILAMMSSHFNSHPLLYRSKKETIETLHKKNRIQISEFCKTHGYQHLAQYLWRNWDRWERFILWIDEIRRQFHLQRLI